jgi:hypothetical protein
MFLHNRYGIRAILPYQQHGRKAERPFRGSTPMEHEPRIVIGMEYLAPQHLRAATRPRQNDPRIGS